MEKKIEQITDEDLMEIWPAIGGAPHLFEYGKEELRSVLVTGHGPEDNPEPIAIELDFYSMAAIVDTLRSRGFQTPDYVKGDGMIEKHLERIKKLGFYYELVLLLKLQRGKCMESIMNTDFYRKHKFDFPKSYITEAPEPEELEQWKDFEPKQPQ